jgi:hypothetical protein
VVATGTAGRAPGPEGGDLGPRELAGSDKDEMTTGGEISKRYRLPPRFDLQYLCDQSTGSLIVPLHVKVLRFPICSTRKSRSSYMWLDISQESGPVPRRRSICLDRALTECEETPVRPQCIFNDYYKAEQIKKGKSQVR